MQKDHKEVQNNYKQTQNEYSENQNDRKEMQNDYKEIVDLLSDRGTYIHTQEGSDGGPIA